ncbi:MAG: phosphatidylglycerophosphatase A [Acidobacteria bacterium]|nr:phosphatidylglycerophosphatase A [Acidobacteriota bacterium]
MTVPLTPTPQTPPEVPEKSRGGFRWSLWLATGLGLGYLPVMPGTYGSALGVGVALGLDAMASATPYPRLVLGFATAAIIVLSLVAIARALRFLPGEDPQVVVLDEVAGQCLALLPLAGQLEMKVSHWLAVLLGFFLVRALDAIKPYPIWKMGHWKGAWGVLADDLGAGAVAALLLAAAMRFGWIL